LQLQNNIFSNTGGGYAIYINQTSSINLSDYNDLYATGSYLGYWSGNCANLAAWKTASSKDPNSISVLPAFVSTTDLHTCNASLNGAGFPVSEINTDIDKQGRNIFTPDIGADEFSGTLSLNWSADTTICGTGILNAGNPGSVYSWSTGATTQTIAVSASGIYAVTVTNACGSVNDSYNVTVLSALVVDLGNDTTVCGAGSLTLNAGNPSASYNWSTGATTQTINVSTPGTYYVDVTNGGCTGSDTIVVSFATAPTSAFNIPATACAMNPVTVTYTGTGTILGNYAWNFDGGTATPGSGQGPHSVYWNTAGTYDVVLTVTENGCTSTPTTHQVSVQATPTNTFTVSNSTLCSGDTVTVTYTGSGTGAATYSWNFGTGTVISGSGQGPYTVVYNTAGSENITLTVSENSCTSPQGSAGITVYAVPTSTFTVTSTAVCSNDSITVTYTGNGGVGAVYNWNFGGGIASPGTGMGPHDVYWPGAGNNNITLTVVNNGCSSSLTSIPVVVSATPTSTFTVDMPTICAYDTALISYTGTGTGAAIYNWNFGGGTVISGSGQGPYSLMFTSAGSTPVSLSVSENGCSSGPVVNNVNVLNTPTSSLAVNPGTLCTGDTLYIQYTGTGTGSAVYSWVFDNATILSGIGQGPYELTWYTGGTYNLGLTVTESGCTSPYNGFSITVNQTPSSGFTVTNPVCAGSDATVTYTGNAAITAIYTWNFDGATTSPAGQGPHTIVWDVDGIKNVTLQVTENSCLSDISTVPVTVNPTPPVPTINQAGNTLASSSSTGNQWYFNGAPIGGATGQFYTATQSGFYQVEVTNGYGCSAISDMLNVNVVYIDDPEFDNSFAVYPNPNSGEFTIEFTVSEAVNFTLKVTDVVGKTVWTCKEEQFSGNYRKQLDIGAHASGIYHLEIISDKFVRTEKLMIK
ncbi:MAG: T9SS type A sorting domain-containing protein, partial [Bacteroidota bacterium]